MHKPNQTDKPRLIWTLPDALGWSNFIKLERQIGGGLLCAVKRLPTAVAVMVLLAPGVADASSGLGGLTSKIQDINTQLVALGGVMAVTGFVWACLSIMIGLAGAAKAVTVLIVGLAIAAAPQIISFLVS